LEILRLLSDIAHERQAAVLLVTHDPQAAAIADRVYGLRDGKLIEGSVNELSDPQALAPRLASGM
jgi:putative ABC transport system ATP-binding protein